MSIQNKKALVVEDEKPLLLALEMKLKDKGVDVTTSFDGEDAIKFLGDNKFDFIILDLLMPNKNGFDVMAFIKKESIDIPVFITTNFNDTENLDKLKKYNISGFFVKAKSSLGEIVDNIEVKM
jgi:two-component system alkaline phosphatase synthesis response regulator PhoP